MGKRISTIGFLDGIPPFPEVQAIFFKQTGLHLSLQASLHISSLTTDTADIARLLQKDADEVERLEKVFRNFVKENPENYEGIASFASTNYTNKLNQLNHVDFLCFHIGGLYEVFFQTEGNKIELHSFIGQYYGIAALENTLIELGGKFEPFNDLPTVGIQKGSQRLKQWHQYKWYNRPRR
ncbi:hypothetical protein GCM10023172_35580 [Hymenobacter ginsengisoli]|uniref:Uncharacterized protein n=1 Tax=Hymenobacter ginsengisoli TaxID=1051626 RepID=A0ABP8QN76_9BACT|nr:MULTISPECIES: hypothetical protein [unclassified Hymenobacter]MBO2033136.1 hypothetical protein [Hymenobacter sp. BT559]